MNFNKKFQIKKNNIICIFLIICLNFTVCCKSSNNDFFIKTYNVYKKAQKKLKEKNFNDAIFILEKLKKNHMTYFIHDKIQINLIYAYYKNCNFNTAQKNIEEFLRIYPNHPNMDYIIYMQCLIKMAMDKNIFFQEWLINYHKNDTYYAISAFFELKNFIYQYPKSFYVINAKKHLIYLKYRLSEHDLKILKFYFLHKEYVAVVNRGEEMIQKYSETPAARKALVYMKKSYIALRIFQTAEKISKIISLNKI
ncbi:outer membrane protein assembly factor BamD [Buchnera aphidicola]|uniref:Outer membrane protein assembly factor BamD n=1 Tax=Buchnera aphidicola str. USDA (Myzus persicae) TaxID=1009856 RepID=W0P3G5_BUCMP|nr:outer membrane protein assembly factor BamD [Buchnera aphidicola]AHG59987.1 Yfio [Buchnera aphidicola str. USDA (Myzus persicae)]AHG60567.1 Yfio [Buchnera aphidicola str. W106 (Myzus persicae)]AHG61140.1 Yfio [Buchnera aphidicola str. G002 (Myzus persicae)]AHG61712.1 Yfio [Buchnera aphidicola str. F009 (Myzus persicae)]WAI03328.1 MAG: outer membrane protein assembly factor BamD [Buchnera aphidicola (Myzus persicae)]